MKTRVTCHNIGKKYKIGERERYKALRDVVTETFTKPFSHLKNIFSPHKTQSASSEDNSIWVLKDVSFSVEPGEVIGIIGRNGAGKTTLLKILSRITEPTEGTAKMHGRLGSLLEVGTGFHPELTGRENIFFNGAILGMKKREIERKFDEIVSFAEVEKFIDTPVKRYSTGMYLRLAFAVAAHLETEILLVDEVLAVGDSAFQKKCLDKMQDVVKEGRTVLFVSHNMAAVTRLCNRTILIEKGRIKCDGPSQRVVTAYLQSDTGTTAAREWPISHPMLESELVKLSAVRIRNTKGEISDTIDIREPFGIEIEYYNKSNKRHPYANVQLYDQNGICIFTAGDFSDPTWRHQPRTFSGKVSTTCVVPGNLLTEGHVTVLVGITTHNPDEVLVYEPDAVSFLVVDRSEGDGARGEFGSDFPGVIRPLLQWKVDIKQEE